MFLDHTAIDTLNSKSIFFSVYVQSVSEARTSYCVAPQSKRRLFWWLCLLASFFSSLSHNATPLVLFPPSFQARHLTKSPSLLPYFPHRHCHQPNPGKARLCIPPHPSCLCLYCTPLRTKSGGKEKKEGRRQQQVLLLDPAAKQATGGLGDKGTSSVQEKIHLTLERSCARVFILRSCQMRLADDYCRQHVAML